MKRFAIFYLLFLFAQQSTAQHRLKIDSARGIIAPANLETVNDSAVIKKYNPAVAIRRSAILPGWGQYTNKKYWKIPLVYTALGIPGFLFFRNLSQYRGAQEAYKLATDGDPTNDYLIKQPYYTVRDQPDRIKTFRNEVRQNIDYSALFFIIAYALNVADAAVDAHLKTFDVSDNLSLELKPGYSPLANTNGISLVLNIR